MSNNSSNTGVSLERNLSPVNVWALALGSIIGWGAFVMPGNTFLPKAGPAGTLIAMAIATLIMISIAFNYHYMINRFPVAGGEFTYTQKSFGTIAGYICAWFLGLSYLCIVPLNATALALIGSGCAAWESIPLSHPMSYPEALLEARGKVKFTGQACLKNPNTKLPGSIRELRLQLEERNPI